MTLSDQEIEKFVERYDSESRALKKESLKISWHMRGGVSYEEAMTMGNQERELINEIIKDNLEVTKKSGLPYF